MAAGRVVLPVPRGEPPYRAGEPIGAGVVRVWEATAPAGVEPLEWRLLTRLPCATPEPVPCAAQGDSRRWLIEEFHQAEKTGCNVELRRPEHTDRLDPRIGLRSVLAVWRLQRKFAARDAPTGLADDFFDSQTVEGLAAYLKTAASTLTWAGFWRGIGRLGGHVGRKCDGPLGWLRAWRGWQSFQLLVLGASLRARDA